MRLVLDETHFLTLVGRGWWAAKPPTSVQALKHPVSWVRFSYEDLMPDCIDNCEALKEIQKFYMKYQHYPDIPYNFYVGVDGTIYEGRGWHVEPTRPYLYYGTEGKCIDICLLGDYENEEIDPPWPQLHAAYSLAIYGLKENYISPQYRTIGFRDTFHPPRYEI